MMKHLISGRKMGNNILLKSKTNKKIKCQSEDFNNKIGRKACR